MSDDLSFFDGAQDYSADYSAEPATPEVTPEAVPAQPQIDAAQIQEMQRRLDAAERWKQDLGRMFLGEQAQPDPNAALHQMLADPMAFQQQTAQTAVQQAVEQIKQESIVQDLRAKNPDIAAIEHLVDWQSMFNQASREFQQKNGRVPSFQEAATASVELVKKSIQGTQQNYQAQQQGDAAKKMAMNLDLSGGQPAGNSKPDPFKMSDAEWAKYRDSLQL